MRKIHLLISGMLLTLSNNVIAQDSSNLRPNSSSENFSIGKLTVDSGSLTPQTPVGETITEYIKEVCPAGLFGPSGLNTFLVSQRHVTTYKVNGHIVGVNKTSWEDVDEDCAGMEESFLVCPVGQKGDWVIGRRVVTDNDGVIQYGPWNDIRNTCDYYKISDSNETRSGVCPVGQSGDFKESRVFEIWSDGSNRNYGVWNIVVNTCKEIPVEPENPFPKGLDLYLSGTFVLPETNYVTQMKLDVREGLLNDVRGEGLDRNKKPYLDANQDIRFDGFGLLDEKSRLVAWNDPSVNIAIKKPTDIFMNHMIVSLKTYRIDDYPAIFKVEFWGYRRSTPNNIYKIGTIYPDVFEENIEEIIEENNWPYPYE